MTSTQAPGVRRVLVTGGSSGIGLSICQVLEASGWSVLNFDIRPPSSDGVGEFHQVDMGDSEALAQVLSSVTAHGPVLGLVNNVAVIRPASVEETTLANVDLEISVIAKAALQCAQAVLPGMRKARYGRIVNITSRAALGKELRTGYSAAKGALTAMTRTWALEFAPAGITVNAVAPGPIATAAFMAANPADSPRTRRIAEGIPMQRLGQPIEVAHAVDCFMDSKASFITGQVLYVCGGITVGLTS